MKTLFNLFSKIIFILKELWKPEIKIYFSLKIKDSGININGENLMLKIRPGQEAQVKLVAKDRFGNVSKLDNVEWSSDNPLVSLRRVSDDDTLVDVVTPKEVGSDAVLTGFVTAKADADLDADEERIINGVLAVVIEVEAETIELEASTPVDSKPDDEPTPNEPEAESPAEETETSTEEKPAEETTSEDENA